ncbi:MAG: trypsin-like serine protease [Gammaproteobacteria bacterium]|nr:trypsin-like serine protease [Gammaproteobacteria bacterium]
MIVYGSSDDSRYLPSTGSGFDGVVLVSSNGYYGTGSLLYNGRAVITAAHLFMNSSNQTANVQFQTSQGTQTLSASSVQLHPNYDSVNNNNDLAIVWLSTLAPSAANRYALYRDSNELGSTLTLVGYGDRGTGNTGATLDNTNATRVMAYNQADMDAGALKSQLGNVMGWIPTPQTQFIADFDNGSRYNDALGQLAGVYGLGLGINEGLIAPGDSGGPAFINGALAGVASYSSSLSTYRVNPDIDSQANNSFGEIAAWQKVSYYQQWLDQSIRAQYTNAPTSPDRVQKQVNEGDSGLSYAYFLLQFTGVRTDPNQWLSVDYNTRDGSASAGQDYIAQQGRLVLYPGENQAVVAVEIIGDNLAEANETFYLDVYNPVGGSFGAGVSQLSAMRTIMNDDWLG